MIKGIKCSKLKIIKHKDGNILHFLKNGDSDFSKFGEVYFSQVKYKKIKAWKKHDKMTMNLVVPSGKVKFVFFKNNEFYDITLSQKNYLRLTIKPKIWFGFMGLDKKISIVANFSNIKHDPFEYKKLPLNKIIYNW